MLQPGRLAPRSVICASEAYGGVYANLYCHVIGLALHSGLHHLAESRLTCKLAHSTIRCASELR